jgi:hypothetical protein
MVRAQGGERASLRKARSVASCGPAREASAVIVRPPTSTRWAQMGAMEGSDEDLPEAEIEFWRSQFQKFVYAKSESAAVAALAEALRSDLAMPDIFRLVLADMLETGGIRGTIEPSWTIKAVRRRDTKQTRGHLAVYAVCKEVHRLVDQGALPTVACREVAKLHNRTLRSVEKSYQSYVQILDNTLGEAKRRADAAIARSKAMREGLASETRGSESDE